MKWGLGPLALLGPEKSFENRWVGSATLNQWGLHGARMGVTDAMLRLRRAQLKWHSTPPELAALEQDGVTVVPNALPEELFGAVRAEARELADRTAARNPQPLHAQSRGFGPRLPFDGGFDRFDGDTLNRFFPVDRKTTPCAARAVLSPRVAQLATRASGFGHRPRRYWLYVTVAGDEARNPDPQRVLHRDTFQPAFKLWLFLDEVREEDGPFHYVVGSHLITPQRRRWEQQQALACAGHGGDGSFRVAEEELAGLGLPLPRAYPVAANTLIIADVRGFHRRGPANAGASRMAIYASLRNNPFIPFAV